MKLLLLIPRIVIWTPLSDGEKAMSMLTITPTVVMRRGEPAREIIAYAEEVGADFIVVGSRGRGGVKALLLGSTSHAVMHGAPCDVIVVRHPK